MEAKILEVLKHPNIVKFKEVYKTKKGRLCIVTEYADGGDLSSRIIAQNNKPFEENLVLDWFTQICLAVKHAHDRRIMHRGLKTHHIFTTTINMTKLGGFGSAIVLTEQTESVEAKIEISCHLSPEIITEESYSLKSDIWSLGVLLYELCALRPPFGGEGSSFSTVKIVEGEYSSVPEQFSEELKNLIQNLLQVNPSNRPDIYDILKNSLIQDRIENNLL